MQNSLLKYLLLTGALASALCFAGCGDSKEKADTKPTEAHTTPFPGTENAKFVQPTTR